MNTKDNFKKWQKYKVLKKKRDLQKQANIYFKYTTEMLQEFKKIKEERKNENERKID